MSIFLIWMACSVEAPAQQQKTAPPTEVESVPIHYHRPTTNGALTMKSLDQRIETLHRGVGGRSGETDLVHLRSMRMAMAGKVLELDALSAIATQPATKAAVLLAAHHFDDAMALDPSVRPSVQLARHERLDDLEQERQTRVTAAPSTTTWMQLADVLAAQGKTTDADAAYWHALEAYRDVSPLTVADIQFRRGLLYGENGADPQRARALYEDAVARLPTFVRAHVHLAELEWDAGEKQAAIRRVRDVAESQDPEPGGKLALWLEGSERETWRTRTITAYDKLLTRHRLAFADHAAEFFIGIGDIERARTLAQDNLANRPTPRAHDLCVRAGC